MPPQHEFTAARAPETLTLGLLCIIPFVSSILADAAAGANANSTRQNDNPTPDSGDFLANCTAVASASSGGAMANSSGMGAGSCATAINAQAMLPQLSAAASSIVNASVTSVSDAAVATSGGTGSAGGNFRVDACSDEDADNPVLFGDMYLVATGNGTGWAWVYAGTLTARCGGSQITSVGGPTGYNFAGTLISTGGSIQINEWKPAGLNDHYLTQEVPEVGNVHPLGAYVDFQFYAQAPPNSAGRMDGSSTASFEIQEVP